MTASAPTTPGDGAAAWPLVLLALWLLCTLGVRPLLMPDEGRYATVAREMLAAGSWLPTLDGLPFFHKPPLFYWVDMLVMRLLGPTAWSARAGALLGGWLMGAAVFWHARHRYGPRVARRALLVLATSPLFFLAAQYANHDMLVAGCIALAVVAFLRALEPAPRVELRWLVLAWLACGAGMLAKGLIGFVLPALVVGPGLLLLRRWRQIPRLFHPLAVLAGIGVAAPWFLAMQVRHPGFFDYFFLEQHVRRFAHGGFNNVQPVWFFVLLLPALTLPWSGWLVPAWRAARAQPQLGWWVLAIVGFFTIPASKLIGYVLPALPAWALLLALALERQPRRHLQAVGALAGMLCLAGVAGLAWRSPDDASVVARALAAGLLAEDRVAMVDAPLHDVAYLANLAAPAVLLGDWSGPKALQQDGWRKELTDAARFDPSRGAALLRPLDGAALPCGAGRWWFVVPQARLDWIRSRPEAEQVLHAGTLSLWRAPMARCAP